MWLFRTGFPTEESFSNKVDALRIATQALSTCRLLSVGLGRTGIQSRDNELAATQENTNYHKKHVVRKLGLLEASRGTRKMCARGYHISSGKTCSMSEVSGQNCFLMLTTKDTKDTKEMTPYLEGFFASFAPACACRTQTGLCEEMVVLFCPPT